MVIRVEISSDSERKALKALMKLSSRARRLMVEEAIERHRAVGVCWTEWARVRGFNPEAVRSVVNSSKLVCRRGQAYQVAVAMGAFPGVSSGSEGMSSALTRHAKGIADIVEESRHDPVDAGKAAGKAIARLLGRHLPVDARMHCIAALAAGLAKAGPPTARRGGGRSN